MPDRELSNALSSGEITNVQLGGTNTGERVLTQDEIDAKGFLKGDGSVAVDIMKWTPQDPITVPYAESTTYYNNVAGTHDVKGKYSDVTLQIGREIHMEVINNSGVTIVNGKPVRHSGVSAGTPQIELAQADTFTNAIILGVTTHDIPNGQKGIITAFGIVGDVDTSSLTVGVPIYLSDTVAGGLTETAPDIITQVGGVLTQDASTGQFFVSRSNNITLPTLLGLLQSASVSDVYNLTATAQNITGYTQSGTVGLPIDPVLGTIDISADGFYSGSFTAAGTFTSTAQTRTIYIEIYQSEAIGVQGVFFTFPFNVPRDATTAGVSFSSKFSALTGQKFVMRLRSDPNMTVTITDVGMDITSIRL